MGWWEGSTLHMDMHLCTRVRAHTQTDTHTRMHAHTHTCTHAHTHLAICCILYLTELGLYSDLHKMWSHFYRKQPNPVAAQ